MAQKKHMETINLSSVSYTYQGAAKPVFSDISLDFRRGWTAVLGDNGIGKTTLAKLVVGLIPPTAGEVMPNPNRLVCSYCEQRTDVPPSNLDDFRADWTPETNQVRETLGIDDGWAYRYAALSGGEAKRLQIACSLALRPDVLVLDEPTNYVDAPTRAAIASALLGFHGIGIVVSHDAELMDVLVQRCVFLERWHVGGHNLVEATMIPGSYSQAKGELKRRQVHAHDELVANGRSLRRLQQVKQQRQQETAHVNALKQKAGRRINPKDSDALQRNKDIRSVGGDTGASRSSARIDARLGKAHIALENLQVASKRYDGAFRYCASPSHRRELLHLGPGFVSFDGGFEAQKAGNDASVQPEAFNRQGPSDVARTGRFVQSSHGRTRGIRLEKAQASPSVGEQGFTIPELTVGPRDHIGICGPNGAGKSTLLRVLLRDGICQGFSSYLAIRQIVDDAALLEAAQRFAGLDADLRSQVVNNYAQLNADPDRLVDALSSSTLAELSPGETQKLLLCLGLLDSPQLLVLDEPTNHLDLHAREALASMLAGFPGAVLVVSHDEWFLREVAPELWWSLGTDGRLTFRHP
ncbi:ATP-binding cassette domain-containing protein [Bifidobacterium bombi]|uniref:ABC transporter, ATP-binding protein n=1 Tax=Bifidobacterium bombi DSM 19703 TaxID=1341695 RepID=A0A080N4F3_9BIFI|nr:ATP-binding cassette domain-containing protein [Bifidobacterium bombi]KFF31300.1 ABC transporter, ATP-binding protein [Bifidobacterium bombi DSM 19703]